jgi:hypothetical protein
MQLENSEWSHPWLHCHLFPQAPPWGHHPSSAQIGKHISTQPVSCPVFSKLPIDSLRACLLLLGVVWHGCHPSHCLNLMGLYVHVACSFNGCHALWVMLWGGSRTDQLSQDSPVTFAKLESVVAYRLFSVVYVYNTWTDNPLLGVPRAHLSSNRAALHPCSG